MSREDLSMKEQILLDNCDDLVCEECPHNDDDNCIVDNLILKAMKNDL